MSGWREWDKALKRTCGRRGRSCGRKKDLAALEELLGDGSHDLNLLSSNCERLSLKQLGQLRLCVSCSLPKAIAEGSVVYALQQKGTKR